MNRHLFFYYTFLVVVSCVDPFNTPLIPHEKRLLVVDGFINRDGPTSIQLSRTMAVNDKKGNPLPELNARLQLESNDNSSHEFVENGGGLYRIENVAIDDTKRYRIRITTRDNKAYVSDFVEVIQTPPIDSVSWEIDDLKRGIQFYVYTHDKENAARYYHWEFIETWQYHADLTTTWEYRDGVVIRNPQQHVYDCWST